MTWIFRLTKVSTVLIAAVVLTIASRAEAQLTSGEIANGAPLATSMQEHERHDGCLPAGAARDAGSLRRPIAPLNAMAWSIHDGLGVYRFGHGEPIFLMPGPHRFAPRVSR